MSTFPARTDAAAAYQRSVLDAFRDVETALVSYANTNIRRNNLAAESAADAQATKIAKLLYEKGVESFLPVLDAEAGDNAAVRDDACARPSGREIRQPPYRGARPARAQRPN